MLPSHPLTSANSAASLTALAWPLSRLHEATEALLSQSGLARHVADLPTPPPVLTQNPDYEQVAHWLDAVARLVQMETEIVETTYADLDALIREAGPALLHIPIPRDADHDEPHFLAVLKGTRRHVTLISPTLKRRRLPVKRTADHLRQAVEAPYVDGIQAILERAGIPAERMPQARRAMLREQLSDMRIGGFYLLRQSPSSGLWSLVRRGRVLQPLAIMLVMYGLLQILGGAGWFFIGAGALSGHYENSLLLAWALILLTAIPFQLIAHWNANLIALGVSEIFRQRLLYGALRLDPNEIKHMGSGEFLGRAMEAEAVEQLALGSGITSILAVVQLISAMVVLSIGAAGLPHALALLLWVGVTVGVVWRYVVQSLGWVQQYREMTNDMVERMLGHRTRLAQETPAAWHVEEDQFLNEYYTRSRDIDQTSNQISAVIGRGWLVIGLVFLAPFFVQQPVDNAALAVSVGGVLLAGQALATLVNSLTSITSLFITWNQIKPIFQAAGRRETLSQPNAVFQHNQRNGSTSAQTPGEDPTRQPVMVAQDLRFQYMDYGRPVLQDADLTIYPGDRILLEGPSGSGKSTLISVLTGLRPATSGLVLLDGLDWATIGAEAWRERVVSAPQFHENHVFTETFAFNLLMGRRWPATPEDLLLAESICRELGLGDLLDRMPSGLQQMVGESGWQLSHGERSRLYIARAILQDSDVIFLDESFAALDPENRRQALECVLRHARSLVVIAHP